MTTSKARLVPRALKWFAVGLGSMMLIDACGGPPPDTDALESTSGALDQYCRNATPSQVFNQGAVLMSPLTYSAPGCFKGYVVQVNDLKPGFFGSGGAQAPNVNFRMGTGGSPGQTECSDMWVGGYVFEQQSDGTYATQDVLSGHGVWISGSGGISGRCDTIASSLNLSEGRTYKFAASARTAQTSQAPTRIVTISTGFFGTSAP